MQSGVGAEGEEERETQADFVLSCRLTGVDLMTLRSWIEPKSRVGHLTDLAIQAPLSVLFFIDII